MEADFSLLHHIPVYFIVTRRIICLWYLCTADADAGELVDTMLQPIIQMLGSCKVSVYGRDNIMELLIKFVTRKDGVGWSRKFIDAQGFISL